MGVTRPDTTDDPAKVWLGAGARWQYRLLRLVAVPILRLVFRLAVVGRANIPRRGGYILVANHLNWIDAPAILLGFPITPRINFVADAGFVAHRRLQWFVARQIGGVIPVPNHHQAEPELAARLRECLDLGGVVGMFPEGRYSDAEGRLLPFHTSFARVAVEAGVPVLPVAISGSRDLWLRKRVTTIVGAPVSPEGLTVEGLVTEVRSRIQALLPGYEEPRGPRLFRRLLSGAFS